VKQLQREKISVFTSLFLKSKQTYFQYSALEIIGNMRLTTQGNKLKW